MVDFGHVAEGGVRFWIWLDRCGPVNQCGRADKVDLKTHFCFWVISYLTSFLLELEKRMSVGISP